MVVSAGAAYVWEDPGDSIMIQLDLGVVDRLRAKLPNSSANSARETEIGGLLLGRVLPGAGRTILIEDFKVVPCEHFRGASYTLSPKDRQNLGGRVARQRGSKQVVGYFRSHTRPGLYLDQDDFAIVSTLFPEPSQVFLVVRPSADDSPEGGFFFWEEREINRRAPYRRFPFDREALLEGGFSITELPVDAAHSAPAPVHRAEAGVARRMPSVHWLAVPALAALVLMGGLFESNRHILRGLAASVQHPAPAANIPQKAPGLLSLDVHRSGAALEVNWDPNSPAIRSADLGVLRINDGPRRLRWELDAAGLARGISIYVPESTDVNFELQVYALTEKTQKQVQGVAPVPPPPASEASREAPAPKAVTEPPREVPPPAKPAPRPLPEPAPAKPLRAPVPPVQVVHTAPKELAPPPPVTMPAERPQPKLAAALRPPALSLPPPPAAAAVTYEPPHASKFKRVLHKFWLLSQKCN